MSHLLEIELDLLSTEQATAIADALADDSDHCDTVTALCREFGAAVWVADDGGYAFESARDTAREAAEEYVIYGDWDDDVGWVDVYVWRRYTLGEVVVDDDEREGFTIPVPAVEPECSEPAHEWCTPHDVVGGIEENPGVWGNGGGVIIHEVCRHCGALRVTNTWAQHNGVQGLTSVSYERPGAHDYSHPFELWRDGGAL